MTAARLAAIRAVERDEIASWRFEELLRAGYAWEESLLLARRRDVDLGTAIRLLRSGCPRETAIRILL